MKRILAIICLIGLSFSYSYAGNMENAHSAYEKGAYKTAYKLLLREAKKGNALAQYDLGNMYINGKGVPRNYKEASKWFRLSAKQGNALAQYNLGVMYRRGVGLSQDNKQAVKWYSLAAKQGIALAECSLAGMYAEGLGTEKDMTTAKRLAKLGVDAGEESCKEIWEKFNLAIY